MTFPYAVLPALVLLAAPGAADGGDDDLDFEEVAEESEEGAYLELGAGVATFSEIDVVAGSADFETGYSLDVLLGYRWTGAVDACFDIGLELEAYYAKAGFDDTLIVPGSSQVDYLAHGGVILGGVLDWRCTNQITFYGGAGVGLATSLTLDSKGDSSSEVELEDDNAMVVQGKLGIRYRLAENLSWFLQYKHLWSEEISASDAFLNQSIDFEIDEDAVEVGMRWDL